MSELLQMSVEKREATGKGPNRRLRAQGLVPCVYYDGAGNNFTVQIPELALEKAYEKLGSTQVFEMAVAGSAEKHPALFWKVLRHPVKGHLLHVDFYGVDLTRVLRVDVPLEIQGTPRGVKLQGGVLEVYRDHVTVECLPMNIPESIVIDVSNLGINQNIHVSRLPVPGHLKVLFDEDFAVVGVSAKAAEDKAGAEEAATAGEGAA